jgi:hypothetical protein
MQAEEPTTVMQMRKLLQKTAHERCEQDKRLVDLNLVNNLQVNLVHDWNYGSFDSATPFEDGLIDGLENAIPTHGLKFQHRSAFEEREAVTNQSDNNNQ